MTTTRRSSRNTDESSSSSSSSISIMHLLVWSIAVLFLRVSSTVILRVVPGRTVDAFHVHTAPTLSRKIAPVTKFVTRVNRSSSSRSTPASFVLSSSSTPTTFRDHDKNKTEEEKEGGNTKTIQPTNKNNDQKKKSAEEEDYQYLVRDVRYQELSQVATIMVEGFYDTPKMNILSRKLTELAELNRLQTNYPYESKENQYGIQHRMLVVEAIRRTTATTNNTEKPPPRKQLVGFCDVDCRPCDIKFNLPRPYVSDVIIATRFRRQGLARQLVAEAEHFVTHNPKYDYSTSSKTTTTTDELFLWIRVQDDNIAAMELYQTQLGYQPADWSAPAIVSNCMLPPKQNTNEPKVWTLRKVLHRPQSTASSSAASSSAS